MTGKSMRELSEWDGLKTFFDPRLVEALGHPVRAHVFAVLNERIASAREISDEIGADVSSFYHHVELLERLGCIERVGARRKRGVKEHFFQAKRTVFFDDEAWQRLPASLRADITVSFVQTMFNEAATAIDLGTFDRLGDEHVSWTPGRLDAQGWRETTQLMNQTLNRVTEIQRESAARLASTGEDGLCATVGMLTFETPKPNEPRDDSRKSFELE